METKLWNEENVNEVINALTNHQCVAFPTETVYGLACIFGSNEAIKNMEVAKMRDESKRFTLMLSSVDDICDYAYINDDIKKVIDAFMPGDITIILNSKFQEESIGIRIPDHPYVIDLINRLGKPLYVTSANISGGKNCNSHEEVFAQLNGRIEGIVKGVSGNQQPSSVVDLRDGIKVLREGRITSEMIRRKLDENCNGM